MVVLRYGADWRWHDDTMSRWYPSVRIVRQRTPGDWPETYDRAAATM